MAKIIWSPQSLEDIEAIADYIALDSRQYARLVIEKLFDSVENIAALPESGRRVPEANSDNIREIFYKRYRIIYELRPQSVEILTVFHSSRILEI